MGRVWDALALIVLALVAWKVLVAPRSLAQSAAYPAPRAVYASLQGPPFVLAQHRGRVVFLDFFATWCEPCRLSLPLVEGFARKHPEVDVVPVDVGEAPDVVAPFARRYGLEHVALDVRTRSSALFNVQGFPTIVVVDAKQRVRATWTGFNPAVELNMANAAAQLR